MTIDLTGPRQKAAHARHHFAGLVSAVQRFDKSGQIAMSASEGLTSSTARVSLQMPAPIPADWSLRIGDVAHNARAALDYLVYILSPLPPDDETRARSMCFPITDNRDMLKRAIEPYKLSPKHAEQLERCQPFAREPALYGHPLALLAEINNIDKHRVLHTLSRKTHVERLQLDDGRETQLINHGDRVAARKVGITFVGDGAIHDGSTPILDLTAVGGGTMTIGLMTQLSFAGDMPLRGQCVYRTLREILDSVDTVLAQEF